MSMWHIFKECHQNLRNQSIIVPSAHQLSRFGIHRDNKLYNKRLFSFKVFDPRQSQRLSSQDQRPLPRKRKRLKPFFTSNLYQPKRNSRSPITATVYPIRSETTHHSGFVFIHQRHDIHPQHIKWKRAYDTWAPVHELRVLWYGCCFFFGIRFASPSFPYIECFCKFDAANILFGRKVLLPFRRLTNEEGDGHGCRGCHATRAKSSQTKTAKTPTTQEVFSKRYCWRKKRSDSMLRRLEMLWV